MNNNPSTLPIRELFELEALTLNAARDKTKLIHQMKNIRSAGDEVEEAVRDFFQRRLAKRCDVGHGHIVDKYGLVSPDIDVVLFDSHEFPSLEQNRDGREYFPFESVYAVAEVKSTYRKADQPVKKFTEKIQLLKTKLQRDQTPANFVGTSFGSGITLNGRSNAIYPYLNPLFCFMFFIDSGDFALEDIEPLYIETPRQFLPNVLCLMDKGLVMYHKNPALTKDHYEIVPLPEFAGDPDCLWALQPLSNCETLSLLWSIICDRLTATVLLRPHYFRYIQKVFQIDDKPIQILESQKR